MKLDVPATTNPIDQLKVAGKAIDRIDGFQAVAWIVAETVEQARAATQWVRSKYVPASGAFDLAAAKDSAIDPEKLTGGPSDTAVGDFAGAFAAAPVKLDATYTTPDQAHAMMEPHASTAIWKGQSTSFPRSMCRSSVP